MTSWRLFQAPCRNFELARTEPRILIEPLGQRPRRLRMRARRQECVLSDTHVPLCVVVPDTNTFLTSDWDMPNCRAICDGLMPALSAARTALTCPGVSETVATSARRLSLDDDRFATDSPGAPGWPLGGNLPRRFASSTDAEISRSSSLSVRCLTALGRSLGRTCRCSCADETFFVVGEVLSPTGVVENRSGVPCGVRSRPMVVIMPPPTSASNFGAVISPHANSAPSGSSGGAPADHPCRNTVYFEVPAAKAPTASSCREGLRILPHQREHGAMHEASRLELYATGIETV
jgi:hypothetical protein